MSTMPTGLTRDAGFEIGVSRTLDVPPDRAWAAIVSDEGVATWLGDGVRLPADPATAKGTGYRTADGTHGEFRSFHPTGRLRLTWQPRDWDHESTVQVTVSSAGGGAGGNRAGRSVVRFHQERLADSDERTRQREHWRMVMDAVVDLLGRRRI